MTDNLELRAALDRIAAAHRQLDQVRACEHDPTRARAATNRLLTEIEKLQRAVRAAVPRGADAPG
jgi:hypothetical protein